MLDESDSLLWRPTHAVADAPLTLAEEEVNELDTVSLLFWRRVRQSGSTHQGMNFFSCFNQCLNVIWDTQTPSVRSGRAAAACVDSHLHALCLRTACSC